MLVFKIIIDKAWAQRVILFTSFVPHTTFEIRNDVQLGEPSVRSFSISLVTQGAGMFLFQMKYLICLRMAINIANKKRQQLSPISQGHSNSSIIIARTL